MRVTSKAVLTAIGALALGGAAAAAAPEPKMIRVIFPDGSVQQISYRGQTAPRVIIVPMRHADPTSLVRAQMMQFDRLRAEMDRRIAAMIGQAAQLPALPSNSAQGPSLVAGERMPPGLVRYSFVSTTRGGKTCSRSMRVISAGRDRAPKVESASSGDCAAPAKGPAPAPGRAPARKMTRDEALKTI